MTPTFPKYGNFEAAASGGCFQCEAPLLTSELADYDFPNGSGRYGMRCNACNMVTFFDVTATEAPVALAAL